MTQIELNISIKPDKPLWYVWVCAKLSRIGIERPFRNCLDMKIKPKKQP